jgi:hypothetical protein
VTPVNGVRETCTYVDIVPFTDSTQLHEYFNRLQS